MILLTICVAPAARGDDKAAATTLFDQGVELMGRKDYATACAKFRESIAASPGLGAMLRLADCYARDGKTASAWAQFRDAASFAAERGDPREKVARKYVTELEPKLSYVSIRIDKPVSRLVVTRDGSEVPSKSWGIALPVDPGHHEFSASAPGRVTWTGSIEVEPVANTEVLVPALEEVPAPSAVVTPENGPVAPRERPSGTQRTIGIAASAAGLAALGVGAFFGLQANAKLDESNDGHCRNPGDVCDREGLALRRDADDAATLATVLVLAGGAVLTLGAVLFLTAPTRPGGGQARLVERRPLVGIAF